MSISSAQPSSEVEVFVPGRLCITGEHTDWIVSYRLHPEQEISPSIAGIDLIEGTCIVCTTNEGLYARCSPMNANKSHLWFESINNDGHKIDFLAPMDVSELKAIASKGTFFSYIAGTACIILQRYPMVSQGISISNYKTTLPMKKGLSSSAAVCVLVAECFSKIYGLNLTLAELMDIAYYGEWETPSQCGRMDQCVAMGPSRIGVMRLDGKSSSLQPLDQVAKPLYFVVVDLKAAKDTVTILRDLNACFRTTTPSTAQRLMYDYHNENGPLSQQVIAAVRNGNYHELAACITQAQVNFDRAAIPNCPSQLTSPRLHSVLADPQLKAISLAGKGVGSQGDGSMQVLCESAEQQIEVCQLLNTQLGCEVFPLTIAAQQAV